MSERQHPFRKARLPFGFSGSTRGMVAGGLTLLVG
jgi:hypothetical protein